MRKVLYIFLFFLLNSFAFATTTTKTLPVSTIMINPSFGKEPLTVTATLSVDSPLTCTAFYLDWGDGSDPIYYVPNSFDKNCKGGSFKRIFTHTYKAKSSSTSTTYTIKAKAGPAPIDSLSVSQVYVDVYGKNYIPKDFDEFKDENEKCFIDPNMGFAPFSSEVVIPLGEGVCDNKRPMKYWIDWGDGSVTEKRVCNSSKIEYKVFKHEYKNPGKYTAKIYRQYALDDIKEEKCEVSIFKDPKIEFISPNKTLRYITLNEPFFIRIKTENIPPAINNIYPTIILGFSSPDNKEIGFIGEIGSTTAPTLALGEDATTTDMYDDAVTATQDKLPESKELTHIFEWTPSTKKCGDEKNNEQEEYQDENDYENTGATTDNLDDNISQDNNSCDSLSDTIKPGVYKIDAYLVYRTCDNLSECKQEDLINVKSVSTHNIEFTNVKPISQSITDRIFVTPQSAAAPAYVYFTTILNSDASCQGGTYTIDFGDGKSVTLAYPKNYCKSFTESFAHIYESPGNYLVILYKNGIPTASLLVAITNPGSLNKSNFLAGVLYSLDEKFKKFWVKILSWLGI